MVEIEVDGEKVEVERTVGPEDCLGESEPPVVSPCLTSLLIFVHYVYFILWDSLANYLRLWHGDYLTPLWWLQWLLLL